MDKAKDIRLVLLDAHAILHRAYHALPDFMTQKGEPTGALYGLSAMLIKIVEDLKPDYIVACYDLKGPTYRHDIFKEYKAQRKKADDDLIVQMNRSRDIFSAFNIPIYDKQGFEADDILGTISERMKDNDNVEVIIASGDMDTMQLVSGDKVKVYTLKKGLNDTIMYNEKAVIDRYGFGPEMVADYKGLRGDPSDNIPGIKGIGEKTATILIQTFGSIADIYKALDAGKDQDFKKVGITPRIIDLLRQNKEEAEFSKMLATIRRDVPITFSLPEKKFKESIDFNKIKTLWQELEFRTLGLRLEKALGEKVEEAIVPEVNKEDLYKTCLALWLVDSNKTDPELKDVLDFANTDSYEEAKKKVFEELGKRGLTNVYEKIELPLIPIVKDIEAIGIKVDKDNLTNLSAKYHEELQILEKKIWDYAGVEFNINSPKQLGEILFDKLQLTAKNMKKTSTGARSTKESELEKMRDLHPIVPLIFEYRELAKLLGTYVDAIPPLLGKDGRLHAKFLQAGTTTGRMSSQDPNLQNIPVKTEAGKAIRYAFVAEKGYKLVAFDYSQMELRIAAFLSGDERLIEIFKKGEDVHTAVASSVFQVPPNEVTPEMRRRAKVINFGIIYGMGVLALKQNLGTSREEAQKFYNDYFASFKTLAEYLDKVKIETAKKGYTETLFGRRRYFEGIKSKIPYIKAQAERMAINAPIQGTEADIIKLSMIGVDQYLRSKNFQNDARLLLQVHDELVYEIKEEKVQEVKKEISEIMQNVLDKKETSGIVMKVEAHVGGNWGELK